MPLWLRDLFCSVRQLVRSPAFAVASVLTLALATGAAATLFALFDALVDRPAAILDRAGVSYVSHRTGVGQYSELSHGHVRALQAGRPQSVLAILAVASHPVILQREGAAERTDAQFVDGDYAAVFRIRPESGRLLRASDDAPGIRNVVISERLWRAWFGGRHDVMGRATILVNNEAFTIAGVMPRGFTGMQDVTDVWLPAASLDVLRLEPGWPERTWSLFVRERPGTSRAQLEGEVAAVFASIPMTMPGRFSVYPLGSLRSFMRNQLEQFRFQMFGIIGLLMLAACTNMSNMLYARVSQRAGEIAIRLSLGAGRMAVVRIFITEIVLIAALAGVIGYALAFVASGALAAAIPAIFRDAARIAPNLRPGILAAGFVAGLVGLSSAVLTCVTLINVSRVPAMRRLAAAAGTTATAVSPRRFRMALVSIQVTVAVILVLGCGLLIVSARETIGREIDFEGFAYETTELAGVRVDLSYHGYTEVRGRSFQREWLHAAKRLPGVTHAALSTGLPGARRGDVSTMHFTALEVHGQRSGQERKMQGGYAAVSEEFLATLGLPLTSGRNFSRGDADGAPLVAIVTENVAQVLWPRGDGIGRRIAFSVDRRPREVIGIVANPVTGAGEPPTARRNALVLVPLEQHYRPDAMVVLRSASPKVAAEAATSAIRTIDSRVAVFDAAPVLDTLFAWTIPIRAAATAITILGAVALVFAALGIYGVMTFYVSTRLREFGIRLALGATPRQVIKLVFDETLNLLLVGLLCGVLLAAIGERILQHNVAALMPNAIATWFATIALVLITGLAASLFPAWHAGQVDPNVALREL